MPIRKQTKIWVTKDKRKIRICDMSDSHLSNTIRLLEREAEEDYLVEFNSFPFGMSFGGEIAQMEYERACDDMYFRDKEDYLPDIYNNLVLEKNRRLK